MRYITRLFIASTILSIFTLQSCTKENETTTKAYEVSGIAQKGPYIVGTNITIAELDEDLLPTGKSYYSTIINNQGEFEFPNVELSSNYVKLIASGYCFNEIWGNNSSKGELTLTSIADISNSSTININILTHLESARLEYLMKNENIEFNDAKKQAQKDVLSMFNLGETNDLEGSEKLDLTQVGISNAKLLAISSFILVGRTNDMIIELLTNIQQDIKSDGVLDNQTLQTDLRSRSELLKLNLIGDNLKNKFNLDTLPDYQTQINYFLNNSTFSSEVVFNIPSNIADKKNIMDIENLHVLSQDSTYYIIVEKNEEMFVRVSITLSDTSISWNYPTTHASGQVDGWNFDVLDHPDGSLDLRCELNANDRLCFLPIKFTGTGKINVMIQHEASRYAYMPEMYKEFILQ